MGYTSPHCHLAKATSNPSPTGVKGSRRTLNVKSPHCHLAKAPSKSNPPLSSTGDMGYQVLTATWQRHQKVPTVRIPRATAQKSPLPLGKGTKSPHCSHTYASKGTRSPHCSHTTRATAHQISPATYVSAFFFSAHQQSHMRIYHTHTLTTV